MQGGGVNAASGEALVYWAAAAASPAALGEGSSGGGGKERWRLRHQCRANVDGTGGKGVRRGGGERRWMEERGSMAGPGAAWATLI